MPIMIDETKITEFAHHMGSNPGLVYVKDKSSTYLSITDRLARDVGYKKKTDIIGTTDYDLPCALVENANFFRALDESIFAEDQDRQIIEFDRFNDGWKLIHGTVTVVRNSAEKSIGLVGHINDITRFPLLNSGLLLNAVLRNKIMQKQPFCLEMLPQYRIPGITKRQSQCLFYTISGLSAKEIAKAIGISPRTVEHHLDKVRQLLDCRNTYQLLEKISSYDLINTFITD